MKGETSPILSKDKVLRKILGLKRDNITGDGRRLHNKEPFVLYTSLNIIRVIQSRRMRWAGHVACMRKRKGA
jgi:hypothetical protein